MTTSTEAPPTVVLSVDDIAALRQADSVTSHLSPYASGIRAHLRDSASEPKIFTAREQRLFPVIDHDRRREIAVSANTAGGYTPSGQNVRSRDLTTCFYMIHCSDYSNTWQTLAGLLKPGDEVELHWCADAHTHELMRKVGLHGDRLQMVIRRGTKRLTFQVASQCSADNSARMVRMDG